MTLYNIISITINFVMEIVFLERVGVVSMGEVQEILKCLVTSIPTHP